MTLNVFSTRRRPLAAAVAILIASAAFATPIANAEPSNSGQSNYAKCVGDALVRGGHDVNPTYQQQQEALFDCCITWSGTWIGHYPDGFCTWPDDGGASRPSPAPGRVVALPPGATNVKSMN